MSVTLERVLRQYVRDGLPDGMDDYMVIPGNDSGPRPSAPYASLLFMTATRLAYPVKREVLFPISAPGADLRREQMVYYSADFSLQYYRENSTELAMRFDQWCMSDRGLMQAETAFVDGQIKKAIVYDGGSGYSADLTSDDVTFQNNPCDSYGSGARAAPVVINGTISSLFMENRGSGYIESPYVTVAGGDGFEASFIGYGFRVKFPLTIRRMDAMIDDLFEERAVIDFSIEYASILTDNTYSIDAVDCEVALGGEVDKGRISLRGST